MTSFNQIILTGYVGKPQKINIKSKKTGEILKSKIVFGLATFSRGENQWHNVEIDSKRIVARLVEKNLYSGNIVNLTGTLIYKKWVDERGKNRLQPVIYVGDHNECKIIASSRKALQLAEQQIDNEYQHKIEETEEIEDAQENPSEKENPVEHNELLESQETHEPQESQESNQHQES